MHVRTFCPPPVQRKARGHSIRLSVVLWFYGPLPPTLTLLQVFMNLSETLQASSSWSLVVHVTFGFCSDNFLPLFSLYELSHFSASEYHLSMHLVFANSPTVL